MSERYNILIKKLDKFIRKYYKNHLIKGGIYCLALLIAFFLIINLVEFFGHFNITVRTIIFYIYLLLNIIIIVRYIFLPLFRLLKIGKIISHEQAAQIIGNHFPQVSDKLTNTLQLKTLSEKDLGNIELINAGIDQKISELKPVPFVSAIDFSKNKKYLKYALPPLLILIVILLAAPNMITEPSIRLVRFNEHFDKEMPFRILILNKNLEIVQHEDFRLEIKVEGEEIPENIYLETGNNRIRMVRKNPVIFYHSFINVQKNLKFRLIADKYKSGVFELKVLPKPIVLDFEINLEYPEYTRKKDETIANNGDLIIPTGTDVTWKFYTKNTDKVVFRFKSGLKIIEQNSSNAFVYNDRFFQSQVYSITTSNEYLKNSDSLTYSISVIPDLYPTIMVEEYRDSVYEKRLYFKGVIKDDYGFDLLTFNYKNKNADNIELQTTKDKLPISQGLNPQQFFHFFDLTDIALEAGDEIEYYFEVWDNDRVNGSKSSRSQIMTFKVPSLKEIEEQTQKSNKTIKNEMEDAIKETKQLQKNIEELNKKLIDKKKLSWEDKQQIQDLLDKQKYLQEKIEAIKNENQEKALKEQQYKEINEEILEKQKQLEELFEKLMQDEELNKLFNELQELLDEVDKDKVSEMLEKMKLSSEELEKMLDRNLEIFKQLEFEQKLEETINKLNELSKEQEELSEKTLDKNNDQEDLKSEQEKISEDFKNMKEELEELDKMNKELEEPNEFDKMEEQQESVEEDMEDSKNSLNKNQRKKASKSQKSSSQKMQKMSQSLFDMQQEMVQEGMSEDIDALRAILENLIQLSFDQENLIEEVNAVNLNDPRYTELIQEQKDINDDLKMVEDSLYALSKRQIMIKPFINQEITAINQNIEKSINYLNNRSTKQAAGRQQYVMTSINNLALMLSETLNQMMQMMMQQCSSNSSCKSGCPKPGQGQSSMKSLRQLQEQLNKQIEKLKSGKKDGGKKPNGKQGDGKSGNTMSEQLARMAAQQEAIRNRLRQYSDQLEKEGQFGTSKELKRIMNEMDKTETDLVNKMITQETLLRQKEIVTRLLKSEKAELEREKEEKRESTEAKNQNYRNPKEIFKYNKMQSNEVELLKTIPPTLKPFYKTKVNQYFINFEELLDK